LVLIYPAVEKALKREYWNYLVFFLLSLGIGVNWILAAVPWMRYNKLEGKNWILEILGDGAHFPLTRWEPSFNLSPPESLSYLLSIFWMGAAFSLTIWFLKKYSQKG
jgi:hypothetical protein